MKKQIHLNLKRFDVRETFGGVNHNENVLEWASNIMRQVQPELRKIKKEQDVEFVVYFPEAHLIPALKETTKKSPLAVGCQSVFRKDVNKGGNFGAFTTNRPASAMKQLGVSHTLIGHYEERLDKKEMMEQAGISDFSSINQILNQEIKMAQQQDMKVLYCIGEAEEEKMNWKEVLKNQIIDGLADIDESTIAIAYEPIWAIGPGKTPPSFEEIQEVSDYIKNLKPTIPVLYGGGLKSENAQGIANIESLDGGLIALTRFSGEIGFYPEEYIAIINEYFTEK